MAVDEIFARVESNYTSPIQEYFINDVSYFGCERLHKGFVRVHAGIDFRCEPGTLVYSSTGGIVIRAPYDFYRGTAALEIKNDDGTIIRYCELKSELVLNQRVKKGDIIGEVVLSEGYEQEEPASMLHLEFYSGECDGNLTNRNNTKYLYLENKNYQRRADLLEPTVFYSLSKKLYKKNKI